ncbi:MAG TPA: translation initiation factor IF-2 N-terminal domain-containing protein [Bacillota bacterium]|nr:translation initiation factor IF-2 N-terminal domain-containing protein [Bacillota bacterium]
MGKVRVYDLAKELGTTSKKLIEVMESMNIEVKNHMSTLEEEQAQQVIAILTGQADTEKAQAKEEPAAVEKKAPPPAG